MRLLKWGFVGVVMFAMTMMKSTIVFLDGECLPEMNTILSFCLPHSNIPAAKQRHRQVERPMEWL